MARPKKGFRIPEGLLPLTFEEAWDMMSAEQQNEYVEQMEDSDKGLCDWNELPDEFKRLYESDTDDDVYDSYGLDDSYAPNDYIDTRPTMYGTVPDDYIKSLLPVLNKYLFYEAQTFETLKEILCGSCLIANPIRVRSTMLLAYIFNRLREKKMIAPTWYTTIEQFKLFLSVKNEFITSSMLRDSVKATKWRNVRSQEKIDEIL